MLKIFNYEYIIAEKNNEYIYVTECQNFSIFPITCVLFEHLLDFLWGCANELNIRMLTQNLIFKLCLVIW